MVQDRGILAMAKQ